MLTDRATGQVYARDDPVMKAVDVVWDALPFDQRQAFINVTVRGSYDQADMDLAVRAVARMETVVTAES